MNAIQKYLVYSWFKQHYGYEKRMIELQLERLECLVPYMAKRQLKQIMKTVVLEEDDEMYLSKMLAVFFCETTAFNDGSIYFLVDSKIRWDDLLKDVEVVVGKLNKYLTKFGMDEIKLTERLIERIKKGAGEPAP